MIIYLKLSSMFSITQQRSSTPHVFTPQFHQLQQQTETPKHQNIKTQQHTETPKHIINMFINEEQKATLVEKTQQYFKQVVTLIMLTNQGLSSTTTFPGKKDYASSSHWRQRKLTNSVRTIGTWAHLGVSGETFASETKSSGLIL